MNGRLAVLDHVSRPEVFAALHAPLVQGYALDALEARADTPAAPGTEDAAQFLQRILEARITEHDGIGLGRDLRFAAEGVAGSGMVAGDELLQLTAFPDAGTEAAAEETPRTHIRRPSRRRAA